MGKDKGANKGKNISSLVVIIAIILIAAIIIVAKSRVASDGIDVGVAQAKALISQGVTVVDVRTKDEYSTGHISGAKSIPLDELSGKLSELDQEKPYLIVCLSGSRSAQAVKLLKSKGFGKVYNLRSGMLSWNREN